MATSTSRGESLAAFFRDLAAHWRVYLLGLCASFGGLLFGWDTGLIGGVLTTKAFQIDFGFADQDDAARLAALKGNIVSVLQAGCFFGAAAGLYLPERMGRRPAIFLAGIIFLIGSIIQTTPRLNGQSESGALAQLYVGRVIGGFGVGLSSACIPAYLAECSPRRMRGRLTGMYQLLNVTGVCVSFFVNYGLSVQGYATDDAVLWRMPFALQCLPGVLLMVGMFFQPESPRWLVEHKGDDHAAALALARILREPVHSARVQDTLADIRQEADAATRHSKGLSFWGQLRAAFATDGKTTYRVSVGIILMVFQQFTGTNGINYYAPQIFRSLGVTGPSSGLLATGIYGICKVTFTALFLLVAMEQFGRKWCLIVGGLIQAFGLYWIGIYQAVRPHGTPVDGWGYATIAFVYIFVVGYSLGWSSVPWSTSSEVAPNHVRSIAMSLAAMTQWLFNFVIAKTTPTMLDSIKFGTFILFGSFTLAGVVWAIFFLPETSGWPLEHLDLAFEGNIVRRSVADLHVRKRKEHRETVLANIGAQDAAPDADGRVMGEGASSTGGHHGVATSAMPTLAADGYRGGSGSGSGSATGEDKNEKA